jgi:hypothetical protein
MTTRRQVAANRRNGLKGGPKTAAGKAVVRHNARKHGIFACALTSEDAGELRNVHAELAAWAEPVGPFEEMLVEKLAQTYLRLQRCARAEAECHVKAWERSPNMDDLRRFVAVADSGRHASWFRLCAFRESVALFARYDQTLTNQLIKLMHELERLQRLRLGEPVPPPVAADLTLSADVDAADIVGGALVPVPDWPGQKDVG